MGALAGVRAAGALAAVVSAALFGRLALAHWGRAGRPAAALFALAAVADLLIGRMAYALGVAAGLTALLALQRGRALPATALAATCAATSPVAGLFLAMAATAVALTTSSVRRAAIGVAVAALVTAAALAVLFPQGGAQPVGPWPVLAVLGASAVVAAAAGPLERTIRAGAALYAVAGVLAFAVPTPMCSNVSRLGAAFGLPVLAGLLATQRPTALPRAAAVGASLALAGLQWWAPVRELSKAGDPSFAARYYAPLVAFLDRAAPGPIRVEVPFTRAHMEAVHLATRRPLARGWQTQLDRSRNELLFDDGAVTAESYERWLRRNGVAYVALPDVPMDPAGRAEAALIRGRPAYLHPVWRSAHWHVFRVAGTAPIVAGPAQLTSLRTDGFTLRALARGRAIVRVRFTAYWVASGGAWCRRAPGGWTEVAVRRPGPSTSRRSSRCAVDLLGAEALRGVAMRSRPMSPGEPLALALLLAGGALLLSRKIALPSLEFDEQVYLASADLLGRGLELGRDALHVAAAAVPRVPRRRRHARGRQRDRAAAAVRGAHARGRARELGDRPPPAAPSRGLRRRRSSSSRPAWWRRRRSSLPMSRASRSGRSRS